MARKEHTPKKHGKRANKGEHQLRQARKQSVEFRLIRIKEAMA